MLALLSDGPWFVTLKGNLICFLSANAESGTQSSYVEVWAPTIYMCKLGFLIEADVCAMHIVDLGGLLVEHSFFIFNVIRTE